MASTIELEIQKHLLQYLDRQIPLHEFEDWFVHVLWSIDRYHDVELKQLAGTIHNRIGEFSRGDRTEASLRQELENAIRPFANPVVRHVARKPERRTGT
jgi:hypothetical protein